METRFLLRTLTSEAVVVYTNFEIGSAKCAQGNMDRAQCQGRVAQL